jgi:phytoene dehydrogenase-like protein
MERFSMEPVAIIGAGLTGLACARHLHANNVPCVIFEAGDAVGGRVRTDLHNSFRLDRGFQVLQTAYAEARAVLDYKALDLKPFEPGALVHHQGDFSMMADPWRRPLQAWATLAGGLAGPLDLFKLYRLRRHVVSTSEEALWHEDELPTIDYLRHTIGFSERLIEKFFLPWFAGIFLESELQTSSRFFKFVFRMLALGDASLPALGMQQIPEQLAAALPAGMIHLQRTVTRIDGQTLHFAEGPSESFPTIVLATEGSAAVQLSSGLIPNLKTCLTVCLYYALSKVPHASGSRWLYLNGDSRGPINNLSFPSEVAPSYAPAGATLLSVSVVGDQALKDRGELDREVRQQLHEWFGGSLPSLEHLKTYVIEHALPVQPVGRLTGEGREGDGRLLELRPGLFCAGDHRETASINGALRSGRRIAEAILNAS